LTQLSAKLADQAEIARLKVEHSHIISVLRTKSESFAEKTRMLALNIEQRMKYADETLASEEGIQAVTISEISTEIARYYNRKNIPSQNVNHYFVGEDSNGRPYSRFKNPNKARNVLEDCSTQYCKDLDYIIGISNRQREIMAELSTITNSDMSPLYVFVDEFKKAMETLADNRKVTLPGHERKEPIRTRINKPCFSTLYESLVWFRDKPMTKFIEFVYNNPPDKENDPRYAAGIVEWGMLFWSLISNKHSLTRSQWITRIKYMVHQSKHGAAVADMVETQICDNCWDEKNQRDKEGCNAEMLWDYSSPTRWRCGTCGGTVGRKRGLTREQIGDNKAPTMTIAEELINYLPGAWEMLDFYTKGRMKDIFERKTRVAPKLSKEA
jgi:hypothetical protein